MDRVLARSERRVLHHLAPRVAALMILVLQHAGVDGQFIVSADEEEMHPLPVLDVNRIGRRSERRGVDANDRRVA